MLVQRERVHADSSYKKPSGTLLSCFSLTSIQPPPRDVQQRCLLPHRRPLDKKRLYWDRRGGIISIVFVEIALLVDLIV